MVWLTGFVVISGEWFQMWQSSQWNGQQAAFRRRGCDHAGDAADTRFELAGELRQRVFPPFRSTLFDLLLSGFETATDRSTHHPTAGGNTPRPVAKNAAATKARSQGSG